MTSMDVLILASAFFLAIHLFTNVRERHAMKKKRCHEAFRALQNTETLVNSILTHLKSAAENDITCVKNTIHVLEHRFKQDEKRYHAFDDQQRGDAIELYDKLIEKLKTFISENDQLPTYRASLFEELEAVVYETRFTLTIKET
jgi:hypothetical protein